jgi:hypothetical protein
LGIKEERERERVLETVLFFISKGKRWNVVMGKPSRRKRKEGENRA